MFVAGLRFSNDMSLDIQQSFHKAVSNNDVETARRMIEAGADVNHFSTEEFPPIVKAASHPHHLVQEVIVCTRLLKMGFRLISTPCFCFAGLSCR